MPKLSEMKGVAFDGRNMGYVPPKKLSISPKLKLQRKAAGARYPECTGPSRRRWG